MRGERHGDAPPTVFSTDTLCVHTHIQVSVAWQFPQFVLIAVAETLVAVTGLEFAFTQCGPNTQSLVQVCPSLLHAVQTGTWHSHAPSPPLVS